MVVMRVGLMVGLMAETTALLRDVQMAVKMVVLMAGEMAVNWVN